MKEKYFESRKFVNLKICGKTFENYRFVDCEFESCSFEDCVLLRCFISECIFRQCRVTGLKASDYSQMRYSEWEDCQLVGIQWSELLPAGKLGQPVRVFRNCRLKYNTFSHLNFKKFDFSGTDIRDSMFAECELTESGFKGCVLERTEFYKCDMRKADFRDASGYQIDIATNKMTGARFSIPEVVRLLDGLGIQFD